MEEPAQPYRPTLTHQWVMLGVAFAIISVLQVVYLLTEDESFEASGPTPSSLVAAAVGAAAHALWISMDCARRGKSIGWWRLCAILFGPITIWTYLVVAYRVKALYLIPLSLLIYFAFLIPPVVIAIAIGPI